MIEFLHYERRQIYFDAKMRAVVPVVAIVYPQGDSQATPTTLVAELTFFPTLDGDIELVGCNLDGSADAATEFLKTHRTLITLSIYEALDQHLRSIEAAIKGLEHEIHKKRELVRLLRFAYQKGR